MLVGSKADGAASARCRDSRDSRLTTLVDLGKLAEPTGINSTTFVSLDKETAPDSNITSAYLLNNNGVSTPLGPLAGYAESFSNALNNSAEVVGYSQKTDPIGSPPLSRKAFAAGPTGAPIDLGNLGGSRSVATAVNNAGEIVGYSTTTSSPASNEAFIYSTSGGMKPV